MSNGLYNTGRVVEDTIFDISSVKPYGDTMNDGMVQVSFTLPVANDGKAVEAARQIAVKMGLQNTEVVLTKELDDEFTFFVIYGKCVYSVDMRKIVDTSAGEKAMSMEEVNQFIRQNLNRKIRVIGASTGTDAHTVGIDAIMNKKGFAGHYGLERYDMIDTFNMGGQIPNEEFVKKAVEFNADALLVSQTVTAKDIHIQNLTELIEILEAEGLRSKLVVCCGGARISNELAKELGYDAGFGTGKYAEDVATFIVKEMLQRSFNI